MYNTISKYFKLKKKWINKKSFLVCGQENHHWQRQHSMGTQCIANEKEADGNRSILVNNEAMHKHNVHMRSIQDILG